MKKITRIVCASMAMALGVAAFSGCFLFPEKEEDIKVMNVSLNPQVEFVLDSEDKVIAINALNEEGNLIISAEAFKNAEGEDAEEVAKLFVEVSTEMGYLVSGTASVGDNQINISISGDKKKAEELYNDVKAKMNETFSAENVKATIDELEMLTEEYLKQVVAECAPYVEAAEMEYKELMATIAESRKETAEYYSQELKNAYYEAKAFAMEQAKLETLKSHLNTVTQFVFDGLNKVYVELVENIETLRMELLVNEDSIYQKALATFRTVKAEYVKARYEYTSENVSVTVTLTEEEYNALKARVDAAEEALLNAGKAANEQLDKVKANISEAYGKVVELLEEYSVKASAHLEEISKNQQEKQAAFFTEFETNYKAAKEAAQKNWSDMQEELEGSEKAAE